MKALSLALILLAALTASAQTQTVTCREIRVLAKTVCEYPDGSALVTDHTSTNYTETRYTPEEWTREKPLILKEEARILADHDAMQKAALEESAKLAARAELEAKANSITNKKKCESAGFVWATSNGIRMCEAAK